MKAKRTTPKTSSRNSGKTSASRNSEKGKVIKHPAARPVKPGSLPYGREEERRGHALPNDPRTMGPKGSEGSVLGSSLGRDESELHGIDDV